MIRRERELRFDTWPHRWFGWWREGGCGHKKCPSIYTFVREKGFEYPRKEEIVRYLLSAYPWAATTRQPCLITGGGALSSLCYRTDGVWQWPDDLAYYVDKQRVCLPTRMLEEIVKNGFAPPAVDMSCVRGLDFPPHMRAPARDTI